MPQRPIGVSDEAAGAGVVEYRTRQRTSGGATVVEQVLLPLESERVASCRASYVSPTLSPSNAAPAATTGNFYLVNNPGSDVLVALRRAYFTSVASGTGGASTPVRFALERFATSTSATGAEDAFVLHDSTYAHSSFVKITLVATGMTVTGAVPFWAVIVPTMITAGQSNPQMEAYRPMSSSRLVIAPGEGVKLRQQEAASPGDARRLLCNLSWEEFTLP